MLRIRDDGDRARRRIRHHHTALARPHTYRNLYRAVGKQGPGGRQSCLSYVTSSYVIYHIILCHMSHHLMSVLPGVALLQGEEKEGKEREGEEEEAESFFF